MASVSELKAQLFKPQVFVCGGHGARWPKVHRHFTVPKGVRIFFYVHDKIALPNDVGQKVDQVLTGGTPPKAKSIYKAGDRCWNYHLFSSRAGGYLNLAMSSKADSSYITTEDKDVGIALEEIIKTITKTTPFADIHWSACRSVESKDDKFGWSKPKYAGALAKIASKADKVA